MSKPMTAATLKQLGADLIDRLRLRTLPIGMRLFEDAA